MAKATLEVGMVIDGFRLEERLHRGGMAMIWRVSHPGIVEPIVMKAPFLDQDGELSLLVGFEVEQMIMAELSGPHVPKWYGNGDFVVQPYIVMEYLQGPTLLKRLDERPLPIPEIVRVAIALADALADLHHQQVIHLDLKPANVLFRPSGEAVIIDFGLSRHVELPDLLEEQFHEPAGTTEYMAPEQLMHVRSDKRSDIFSVGAMLYQLAAGNLPFGAPRKIKLVRDRVWMEPTPPRALREDIPPALQEIILKCIEPLPNKRYDTAGELAFDLRHLDLVPLTERAHRMERSGFGAALSRRFRLGGLLREIKSVATRPPPRAPIVLVVVDLDSDHAPMRDALMDAAVNVLANMPGARLACLDVMLTPLIGATDNVDKDGDNIHVNRLGQLREWAAPLGLPRSKITYHLLETRTYGASISEFARTNAVDHLILGAPAIPSTAENKQMAQIMLEAPCSVSIVRVPTATAQASAE
jgi:hypothetical protein